MVPISAWLEAPLVGNHWVLAAAVSLAFLVAAALKTGRRGRSSRGDWPGWDVFLPTARVTLLIAYAFAAFAKLNSSFFDPAVSCAVFYQHQLVNSWGLGSLSVYGRPGLGTAVAVGAAATEMSVVILLVIPRTRRVGVLVALSFHWLLALDLDQHFWDFSSVLFPGFLLFLDRAQWERLTKLRVRLRRATRPAVRYVFLALGAGCALVVAAATALETNTFAWGLAVLAGHGSWMVIGTATLVLVVVATVRTPRSVDPVPLRVPAVAALLVPALVLFNGLTPYLELKTGFGWNMYGNLRTVAGESNHFIVARTLDLSGLQADQVEILESSDPALASLVGADYTLAYSEFREYAHAYPEASVTYRRGGQVHRVARIGDDPAGTGGVSTISTRLQSFRVIDTSGRERCQAVFTPAR